MYFAVKCVAIWRTQVLHCDRSCCGGVGERWIPVPYLTIHSADKIRTIRGVMKLSSPRSRGMKAPPCYSVEKIPHVDAFFNLTCDQLKTVRNHEKR